MPFAPCLHSSRNSIRQDRPQLRNSPTGVAASALGKHGADGRSGNMRKYCSLSHALTASEEQTQQRLPGDNTPESLDSAVASSTGCQQWVACACTLRQLVGSNEGIVLAKRVQGRGQGVALLAAFALTDAPTGARSVPPVVRGLLAVPQGDERTKGTRAGATSRSLRRNAAREMVS